MTQNKSGVRWVNNCSQRVKQYRYNINKQINIQTNTIMGNTPLLPQELQFGGQKPQKLKKQKQQQQYAYISDPKISIVGKPRLVKSNFTGIELEEYLVSSPQSPVQFDANIYKLRSSSYSKNIAVVFHHKLINQSQKLFMVRIQKMKARLNQIQGLNVTQGLCFLQAALNGYSELIYHAKTPFVVTEKMIAINQSPQIRVWLNENYAINKIMPGIKIRNQNIMIHQVFSAIAEHIAMEQRQAYGDIRFKIAQCQRLVDAKNIVTMILQNINRKAVLQQFLDKLSARMNKNVINNQNMVSMPPGSPIAVPTAHGMPHNNPSNIASNMPHPNMPANGHFMQNGHSFPNIKIPMNYSMGPPPGIVLPNNINNLNNSSPNMGPVNSMQPGPPLQENSPPQRIQIVSQQYIKDDQGQDRIRMVRQQHNPNSRSFNYSNTNVTAVTQPLPIFAKISATNQYAQPNRNYPQPNQIVVNAAINGNASNKNANLTMNNINNQNIGRLPEENVTSNPHQENGASHLERAGMKSRSIFAAAKTKNQQNSNSNIGSVLSPRNVSPLRAKATVIQFNTQNKNTINPNMSSKIALSQNKISQMQKKINKLKQQLTKNNEFHHRQKQTAPYVSAFRNERFDKVERMKTVTPPHATFNKSTINQQYRPPTRHQKNNKLKSETAVGQTAAKWDKKLGELNAKDLHNTHNKNDILDDKRQNQPSKTHRKSEISSDQPSLRKSMITQGTSKNSVHSALGYQLSQNTNNRDLSPKFRNTETQKITMPAPFVFNQVSSTTPKFVNGVYPLNNGPYTIQPKLQINYNSSPFYSTIHNGFNGYSNLSENKSSFIHRKSHF